MLLDQRNHANAPSDPHTALVEVKGEIAAGADASAENLVAALKNAFEDEGAQRRRAAHQLARRQPGAGRHRQRRDPAPEGAARQEGLRGGRGDVRLGRLLHRRRGRRHLCRQGVAGRLDRRADRQLRLHRRDGQARRRAPPHHRRREQGHARPVLAARPEAARLCAADDRPDPPAVHRGGQGRPRRASQASARAVLGACSGTASRRWRSASSTGSATSTTSPARWSRPRR